MVADARRLGSAWAVGFGAHGQLLGLDVAGVIGAARQHDKYYQKVNCCRLR